MRWPILRNIFNDSCILHQCLPLFVREKYDSCLESILDHLKLINHAFNKFLKNLNRSEVDAGGSRNFRHRLKFGRFFFGTPPLLYSTY